MAMRALIADDDLTSRRMLELVLSKLGYEVIAESNGMAALERLSSPDAPQIAILDWMMPQLDGPEVVRRVRARPDSPYIYILLLTGKTQSEDIVRGLESGADDYVVKPFNINELRARLRAGQRVLESQNAVLKAQEALRAQAAIDPASGLLGPATLMPCLGRELARNRMEHRLTSVIVVGIDALRAGTLSREVADRLMSTLSVRLIPLMRPMDALIRAGDGLLCAVLPGVAQVDAQLIAQRMREASRLDSVEVGNQKVSTAVSTGIATTDNELDAYKLTNAARQNLIAGQSAGAQPSMQTQRTPPPMRTTPPALHAERTS